MYDINNEACTKTFSEKEIGYLYRSPRFNLTKFLYWLEKKKGYIYTEFFLMDFVDKLIEDDHIGPHDTTSFTFAARLSLVINHLKHGEHYRSILDTITWATARHIDIDTYVILHKQLVSEFPYPSSIKNI